MVKIIFDTSRHQEARVEMRQVFSPRQINVLDLVSEGLNNKDIARCLMVWRENLPGMRGAQSEQRS